MAGEAWRLRLSQRSVFSKAARLPSAHQLDERSHDTHAHITQMQHQQQYASRPPQEAWVAFKSSSTASLATPYGSSGCWGVSSIIGRNLEGKEACRGRAQTSSASSCSLTWWILTGWVAAFHFGAPKEAIDEVKTKHLHPLNTAWLIKETDARRLLR